MKLIAIAVVASNRVIGDGKDQPFKFREDWARFKRVTMGHPLISGRKTFDAMGILKGRVSIVITRSPDKVINSVEASERQQLIAVTSLDDAIAQAAQLDDIAFIIGGGEIYRQAMDLVDELDLTLVHAKADGHVTFPKIGDEWVEVERVRGEQFDFVKYQRAQARDNEV